MLRGKLFRVVLEASRDDVYYNPPGLPDWLRSTAGSRGDAWDLIRKENQFRVFRFFFKERSVARRFQLYVELHGIKVLYPVESVNVK